MSNERKPHPHAEVIKAWADGATIQYYCKVGSKWKDVTYNDPRWYPDTRYRVKPEPKVLKYRPYLWRCGNELYIGIITGTSDSPTSTFVRWAGPEQTVELTDDE